MSQKILEALQRGDSAGLLRAIGEGFRQGLKARELAEEGLRYLLVESGWELRGARWSHAFLCLEAAHRLARTGTSELGEPAVVGALAFLDGSSPTRSRPLDPDLTGSGGECFEEAVQRSDFAASEEALIDLLEHPQLERRWFELAVSNLEGWGHRPLIAAACWRLSAHLDAPPGWLLRAGLRQWVPWELEPKALPGAHSEENKKSGEGAGEVSGDDIADWVGNGVLAGWGSSRVSAALSEGAPASEVFEGVLRAACHSFSALPELRQLHGVTVSRAVGEGVLVHGAAPDLALAELAGFVGEGWASARRSGRILPGQDTTGLSEPGGDFDPELMLLLCRREATPNFGHLIKLVDAVNALPDLMSPELGRRWAGEVLQAATRTATPYRRVWATVRRHMESTV